MKNKKVTSFKKLLIISTALVLSLGLFQATKTQASKNYRFSPSKDWAKEDSIGGIERWSHIQNSNIKLSIDRIKNVKVFESLNESSISEIVSSLESGSNALNRFMGLGEFKYIDQAYSQEGEIKSLFLKAKMKTTNEDDVDRLVFEKYLISNDSALVATISCHEKSFCGEIANPENVLNAIKFERSSNE
jgi:hypothetical protein